MKYLPNSNEGHLNHDWRSVSFGMVLLALAAVVLSIMGSDIHSQTSGDSILPVLVSTVLWSPHYWGQDRFGMALPGLAAFIKNPLFNLLAQNLMSAFLGLLAPFLIALYLFGPRLYISVGASVAAFYIAALTPFHLYTFLGIGQPYAPALGFGYAGLCLFTQGKGRLAAALCMLCGQLLLILSFWLTPTMLLTLVPLVALKRLLGLDDLLRDTPPPQPMAPRGSRFQVLLTDRTIFLLLALFLAFGLSFLASRLSPYMGEYYILPLAEWPASLLSLLSGLLPHLGQPWARSSLAAATLLGAGLLFLPWKRGNVAWAAKVALTLGIAMLLEIAIVSTNAHVKLNDFDGRYLYITRNILCTLTAVLFFAGLYRHCPQRVGQAMNMPLLALFMAVALANYGLPSLRKVRNALDQATGKYTAEIVGQECTHVGGDYWVVWPAVFHANLTYYEQGSDKRVFGVSERAQNTQHIWSALPFPDIRLCGAKTDSSFSSYVYDMGVLKPRSTEFNAIRLYTLSMPLLYGTAIEPAREVELFPNIQGAETIMRTYASNSFILSTFEFKRGGIFGYEIQDKATGARQLFLDKSNTATFVPAGDGATVNLQAYGIDSQTR